MNSVKITLLSVAFFLALNGAMGSPLGAPLAACDDMTPQHGVPPQNTSSLFVTTLTAVWIRFLPLLSFLYVKSNRSFHLIDRAKFRRVLALRFSSLPSARVTPSKVSTERRRDTKTINVCIFKLLL